MPSPDPRNYHVALRGVLSFAEDGRTFRCLGNAPRFVYSVGEDGTRTVDLELDEITEENMRWMAARGWGTLRFEPTNTIGPLVKFEADVRRMSSSFIVIAENWSTIKATLVVQPQTRDPWIVSSATDQNPC